MFDSLKSLFKNHLKVKEKNEREKFQDFVKANNFSDSQVEELTKNSIYFDLSKEPFELLRLNPRYAYKFQKENCVLKFVDLFHGQVKEFSTNGDDTQEFLNDVESFKCIKLYQNGHLFTGAKDKYGGFYFATFELNQDQLTYQLLSKYFVEKSCWEIKIDTEFDKRFLVSSPEKGYLGRLTDKGLIEIDWDFEIILNHYFSCSKLSGNFLYGMRPTFLNGPISSIEFWEMNLTSRERNRLFCFSFENKEDLQNCKVCWNSYSWVGDMCYLLQQNTEHFCVYEFDVQKRQCVKIENPTFNLQSNDIGFMNEHEFMLRSGNFYFHHSLKKPSNLSKITLFSLRRTELYGIPNKDGKKKMKELELDGELKPFGDFLK